MSPRQSVDLPGHRHFVTFSTYQRRQFLDSEHTRNIVLEVLQRCLVAHRTKCAGFVIMPNHVHAVLFGEPEFKISRFIQVWKKTSSYRLKRFYIREVTHYHQLCPDDCPIWQSGFYDFNVESDQKFNEKLKYMHNNPVVAGLSCASLSWSWSSARYYECGDAVGVTITP